MPVRKYRGVEEMPAPAPPSSAELAERIRALWNRAFLLSPPCFTRGVSRFRSIEAANEQRAAATAARMRAGTKAHE